MKAIVCRAVENEPGFLAIGDDAERLHTTIESAGAVEKTE
jgi:hypothetical protein